MTNRNKRGSVGVRAVMEGARRLNFGRYFMSDFVEQSDIKDVRLLCDG